MGHLVAVDLETSGLDPDLHEIIEVGLVFRDRERDGVEFDRFINFSLSFDESKADPRALEINGWSTGREFPPLYTDTMATVALARVLDGAHMLGKNVASFDARFLESWFKRHGYIVPKWHHRMVDVGTLCMGRFRLDLPPNTAEVESLTGVKIPEGERHGALADAKWAWDVYHWVKKS